MSNSRHPHRLMSTPASGSDFRRPASTPIFRVPLHPSRGSRLAIGVLLIAPILLAACARTSGDAPSAAAPASTAAVTVAPPMVRDYLNPLDVPVADPQILHDGGMYYLYGTTASDEGLEVFSSPDLVHWRRHGFCYHETPTSWGQIDFWAPEVIRKGDTYYLFYTANNPAAHVRSICVATSPSPLGPFVDRVTPIMPPNRGFIDASPYLDPSTGIHYLYVMEENLRPPKIWVARLSDDLLSLASDLTECLTASQPWETGWVEGPFVIKRGDWYYMTYSGCGYASPNYAVGVATAKTPLGPWTKYPHNPVLYRTAAVSGPGHNSIVDSPDGSELFIAYHRHLTYRGSWQRELGIDRIQFIENAPDAPIFVVDGPTHVPRPFPSDAKPHALGASDEFNGTTLDFSRWMSFGEDRERWRVEGGSLCVTTQDGDVYQERLDAKNLFLQYAPEGDFAIETRVDFTPEADFEQAFLMVWQDESNFLKIASVFSGERKFEAAREVNGKYTSGPMENRKGTPVRLRIEKTGTHYDFFVRGEADASWEKVTAGFDADFRQIQVGLGAIAPVSNAPRLAKFDYFRIELRK